MAEIRRSRAFCIISRRPEPIGSLTKRTLRPNGNRMSRWNSIAPLTRKPVITRQEKLFYVGDAARVVEPFTGEGILYALKSGLLAAETIKRSIVNRADCRQEYWEAHRRLYTGRLWINRLARWSVLHPQISSNMLEVLRFFPGPLNYLAERVVGSQ